MPLLSINNQSFRSSNMYTFRILNFSIVSPVTFELEGVNVMIGQMKCLTDTRWAGVMFSLYSSGIFITTVIIICLSHVSSLQGGLS